MQAETAVGPFLRHPRHRTRHWSRRPTASATLPLPGAAHRRRSAVGWETQQVPFSHIDIRRGAMIIAQISDSHITQVGGKADQQYATATHLQRAVAHLTRLPAPRMWCS